MADGHEVRTIEGLAADGAPLHPMQEAFREHHGLQCGFCTPGMIMTAVDLVHRKGHDLSDHTIREELEGNLCRCTGYQNIVLSIAAGRQGDGELRISRRPMSSHQRSGYLVSNSNIIVRRPCGRPPHLANEKRRRQGDAPAAYLCCP